MVVCEYCVSQNSKDRLFSQTYSRCDFAVAVFAAATLSAADAPFFARDALFFRRPGEGGGDVAACLHMRLAFKCDVYDVGSFLFIPPSPSLSLSLSVCLCLPPPHSQNFATDSPLLVTGTSSLAASHKDRRERMHCRTCRHPEDASCCRS